MKTTIALTIAALAVSACFTQPKPDAHAVKDEASAIALLEANASGDALTGYRSALSSRFEQVRNGLLATAFSAEGFENYVSALEMSQSSKALPLWDCVAPSDYAQAVGLCRLTPELLTQYRAEITEKVKAADLEKLRKDVEGDFEDTLAFCKSIGDENCEENTQAVTAGNALCFLAVTDAELGKWRGLIDKAQELGDGANEMGKRALTCYIKNRHFKPSDAENGIREWVQRDGNSYRAEDCEKPDRVNTLTGYCKAR